MAVLFLVVALAFAGCLADAPGDTGGGDPGSDEGPVRAHEDYEVVLTDRLDAAGCTAVELLFEVPSEHAASHLPEGLVPARSPVSGTNAAITLELRTCDAATTTAGDANAVAVLLVMIEPPPVPVSLYEFDQADRTAQEDADTFLDFYALAAHTDDEALSRLFRQSGVPFGLASIDLELTDLDTLLVHDARIVAADGGDEILRTVGSSAAADPFTELRRVWRLSPHGVQLFEEHQGDVGGAVPRAFGSATCVLGEDGAFPSLFLPGCVPTAVRTTPTYDTIGASYWFHGARLNQ